AVDELDVCPYGFAAVSLGRMVWSGTAAAREFRGTVRFEHVWVERDGAWRLVASQLTGQPQGGRRRAAAKAKRPPGWGGRWPFGERATGLEPATSSLGMIETSLPILA